MKKFLQLIKVLASKAPPEVKALARQTIIELLVSATLAVRKIVMKLIGHKTETTEVQTFYSTKTTSTRPSRLGSFVILTIFFGVFYGLWKVGSWLANIALC